MKRCLAQLYLTNLFFTITLNLHQVLYINQHVNVLTAIKIASVITDNMLLTFHSAVNIIELAM